MIFLNSGRSAKALVFYLPGVCTHTDTEGKQRKAIVWIILKSSEKTPRLLGDAMISKFHTFARKKNTIKSDSPTK